MATRQLSAIMFTDLVGYTAMMQENEAHAKQVRDTHRQILEKSLTENGGKVLQYYGDGALSIFSSTISASHTAVSIQQQSIKSNIPLRIGIHTGDIVIDEDGVYGDGVNIASRIESFSVPGSVMISDKVYDDIKNHLDFKPLLMGEFELKNVKKPVEVYALSNKDLIIPKRKHLSGKVKEKIKKLLVLPFTNRSSESSISHFCDGLTEDFISHLSENRAIQVISKTSAFSLKDVQLSPRQLGEKLDVNAVFDGSVRSSGNKIRINAQLSSTLDDFQIWSGKVDRILEDEFELQDELTAYFTNSISVFLNDSTNVIDDSTPGKAYDYLLKGQFYYNKWTPDYAFKAIESFEKAIEIDPEYDQAYAGVAIAYSLISTTGAIDPEVGYQKLQNYAEKALEINANSEQAHMALAFRHYFHTWQFEEAHAITKKALEINPKSSDANLGLALYYTATGQVEESIKYIQRAREVDPLSILVNRTLADAYYFKGDYETSIEMYDWLLQQDPDFLAAKEFKAWCYLMMREYDKALEIFNGLANAAHAIQPYVQLGYTYALMNNIEEANKYLHILKKQAEDHPESVFDLNFAILFAGLGDKEKTLQYLKSAMDKKIGAMLFLKVSPIWNPVKDAPEFQTLVKEIGI